jgi:hypothetical protein
MTNRRRTACLCPAQVARFCGKKQGLVMRRFAAALILAFVAQPTIAQQSVLDELGAAHAMVYGGLDDEAFGNGAYFDALTDSLDGTWFFAGTLRDMLGDPEAAAAELAEVCRILPVTMTVTPPWTITASRGTSDLGSSTVWTYLSGTRFSAYTDPAGIVAYYRIDEADQYERGRGLVILGNQEMDLYRLSPDVLIAVRSNGGSQIYGRCPGGDVAAAGHTPEALAALDTALGIEFDRAFPKVKSSDVRVNFLDCTRAAMTKLTPEDLQILVDSRFVVPNEVSRRFEEQYPEIGSDNAACMSAAQEAAGR